MLDAIAKILMENPNDDLVLCFDGGEFQISFYADDEVYEATGNTLEDAIRNLLEKVEQDS